ncbi:MAG: biopolymer transporter ExbD [Desulfobacter sp.]|nr:biopolymer transporter ExbD [Desulfobacter sp.]WDP84835.1 MAG: biopolymer transporter ExbD [Desulfobacter sp.]
MLNISAARRTQKKSLELNIAPLIDMVFILLIFFLVTTSFVKETGVDISRPSASTAQAKTRSTILLGVTKESTVHLDQREVDLRAVQSNVERALAENPESAVVIVADKESRTGLVISVMDACKLAGAKTVSIAASLPKGR